MKKMTGGWQKKEEKINVERSEGEERKEGTKGEKMVVKVLVEQRIKSEEKDDDDKSFICLF